MRAALGGSERRCRMLGTPILQGLQGWSKLVQALGHALQRRVSQASACVRACDGAGQYGRGRHRCCRETCRGTRRYRRNLCARFSCSTSTAARGRQQALEQVARIAGRPHRCGRCGAHRPGVCEQLGVPLQGGELKTRLRRQQPTQATASRAGATLGLLAATTALLARRDAAPRSFLGSPVAAAVKCDRRASDRRHRAGGLGQKCVPF